MPTGKDATGIGRRGAGGTRKKMPSVHFVEKVTATWGRSLKGLETFISAVSASSYANLF